MKTEIKLEEINPFVRYVHTFGPKNYFGSCLHAPCDARCFLVRRGEVEIVMSQERYRLTEHQMLLVPAGCAYFYSDSPYDTEVLGINFDYTRQGAERKSPIAPIPSDRFREEDLPEQIVITDFSELQMPILVSNATGLLDLAEEIETEYAAARSLTDATLSAKMKLLIIGIVERIRSDRRASETVRAVISFIHLHCTEHISNLQIGQALNFHPNYLNRLMQHHTGKSLHAYLIHCRVLHAIRLLQTTTLSAGEVATSSGFGDLQQFSKIFRHITGHTPSEFRKMT